MDTYLIPTFAEEPLYYICICLIYNILLYLEIEEIIIEEGEIRMEELICFLQRWKEDLFLSITYSYILSVSTRLLKQQQSFSSRWDKLRMGMRFKVLTYRERRLLTLTIEESTANHSPQNIERGVGGICPYQRMVNFI